MGIWVHHEPFLPALPRAGEEPVQHDSHYSGGDDRAGPGWAGEIICGRPGRAPEAEWGTADRNRRQVAEQAMVLRRPAPREPAGAECEQQ